MPLPSDSPWRVLYVTTSDPDVRAVMCTCTNTVDVNDIDRCIGCPYGVSCTFEDSRPARCTEEGFTFEPTGQVAECTYPANDRCPEGACGSFEVYPPVDIVATDDGELPQPVELDPDAAPVTIANFHSPIPDACGIGYDGDLCGECRIGWVQACRGCSKCESDAAQWLAVLIGAGFYAALIILIWMAKDRTLDHAFQYLWCLQLVGLLYYTMNICECEGYVKEIFRYFTLPMIDFYFFVSGCPLEWVDIFTWNMIFFAIVLFIVQVGIVVRYFFQQRQHRSQKLSEDEVIRFEKQGISDDGKSRKDRAKWRFWRGSNMVASLGYVRILMLAMEALDCRAFGDNERLTVQPSLICFKGQHLPIFVVSLLLIVACIVLPMYWLYYCRKYWVELTTKRSVYAKIGHLYAHYSNTKIKLGFGFVHFLLLFFSSTLVLSKPHGDAVQHLSFATLYCLCFGVLLLVLRPHMRTLQELCFWFLSGFIFWLGLVFDYQCKINFVCDLCVILLILALFFLVAWTVWSWLRYKNPHQDEYFMIQQFSKGAGNKREKHVQFADQDYLVHNLCTHIVASRAHTAVDDDDLTYVEGDVLYVHRFEHENNRAWCEHKGKCNWVDLNEVSTKEDMQKRYCIAQFDYKALDEDELSFKRGDRIEYLWPAEGFKAKTHFVGELHGKRGLVPNEKVETQVDKSIGKDRQLVYDMDIDSRDFGMCEVGVANRDYEGVDCMELSIRKGQRVDIIDESPDGKDLYCQLEDGSKGWVLASYIDRSGTEEKYVKRMDHQQTKIIEREEQVKDLEPEMVKPRLLKHRNSITKLDERVKIAKCMKELNHVIWERSLLIPYLRWRGLIRNEKNSAIRKHMVAEGDHDAERPNYLTTSKGDKIYIIDEDKKTGRYLAELDAGEQGWVDKELFKVYENRAKEDRFVEATYTYEGQKPGELSFQKGDRIKMLRQDPDHGRFLGILGDKEGWVYLKKPQNKATVKASVKEIHHHSEFITVREDYDAQNDNELTVKKGDKVKVLQRGNESGRVFVEKDGQKGWINADTTGMSAKARQSITTERKEESQEVIEMEYAYKAEAADEISFAEGDKLEVLDREKAGCDGRIWCRHLGSGHEGWVLEDKPIEIVLQKEEAPQAKTHNMDEAMKFEDSDEEPSTADYMNSLPEEDKDKIRRCLTNLGNNLSDSSYRIPFLKWRGFTKSMRPQDDDAYEDDSTNREFVVATYDHRAKAPTDLSFQEGEKIKVIAKDEVGGRFLGENRHGKAGWVDLQRFKIQLEAVEEPQQIEKEKEIHHHYNEVAVMTYDHEAEPDSDELTFKTGDRVTILEKGSDSRLFGELDGKKGWFVLAAPKKVVEVKEEVEWFMPSFDYTAQKPGELSFKSGTKLKVLKRSDDGTEMFLGEDPNGSRGWAPLKAPKKAVDAPILDAAAGADVGGVSGSGFLTGILGKPKATGTGLLSGMFAAKELHAVKPHTQPQPAADKPAFSFKSLATASTFGGPPKAKTPEPRSTDPKDEVVDKPAISFGFTGKVGLLGATTHADTERAKAGITDQPTGLKKFSFNFANNFGGDKDENSSTTTTTTTTVRTESKLINDNQSPLETVEEKSETVTEVRVDVPDSVTEEVAENKPDEAATTETIAITETQPQEKPELVSRPSMFSFSSFSSKPKTEEEPAAATGTSRLSSMLSFGNLGGGGGGSGGGGSGGGGASADKPSMFSSTSLAAAGGERLRFASMANPSSTTLGTDSGQDKPKGFSFSFGSLGSGGGGGASSATTTTTTTTNSNTSSDKPLGSMFSFASFNKS